MPTRSPRTAVMALAGAAVVFTGVVVGGRGTLVGASGAATDPLQGNGPSDVTGSRRTSDADAFLPLPAATRTAATMTPTSRIARPMNNGRRSRPPPAGGGAVNTPRGG